MPALPAILLAALIAVESGGDPKAQGDHQKAVGILQIHQDVVVDVNRFFGPMLLNPYRWPSDAFDEDKAKVICQLYLQHYATEARLGHKPTEQDLARIWNGGPNGYKEAATIPYWVKVSEAMAEIQFKQLAKGLK